MEHEDFECIVCHKRLDDDIGLCDSCDADCEAQLEAERGPEFPMGEFPPQANVGPLYNDDFMEA